MQSILLLVLPANAVLRRSEITGVYVVVGDRVQFRQLRVGQETSAGVEVLAGLCVGEKVVLEPVKAGIYLKQQKH